jgi:hypothetical protein
MMRMIKHWLEAQPQDYTLLRGLTPPKPKPAIQQSGGQDKAERELHRKTLQQNRNAARRDADTKPLRQAYGHYRTEKRQFYRAAGRLARGQGTVQGLRREYRQDLTAGKQFGRTAVRLVRSHPGVSRPLDRAYKHLHTESGQLHRAAKRFAGGHGSFASLRREVGQFKSARGQFYRTAAHVARRR